MYKSFDSKSFSAVNASSSGERTIVSSWIDSGGCFLCFNHLSVKMIRLKMMSVASSNTMVVIQSKGSFKLV